MEEEEAAEQARQAQPEAEEEQPHEEAQDEDDGVLDDGVEENQEAAEGEENKTCNFCMEGTAVLHCAVCDMYLCVQNQCDDIVHDEYPDHVRTPIEGAEIIYAHDGEEAADDDDDECF